MKKGPKKGSKRTYEHHIKIDGENMGDYTPKLVKTNYLKQGKIYDNFCILNQDFLLYIMSSNLTKNDYKILMFLLAYMNQDNRIIIDSEMIEYHLGINKTVVNKHITKLQKLKIIYKRNLGYKKGQELLLNFDIMSPHIAFKNANNQATVSDHKRLMSNKEKPYLQQTNAFTNEIDYINPETGEVFHTSPIKK